MSDRIIDHASIRAVDDLMTLLWMNSFLVANGYYNAFIMDMHTPQDGEKWTTFLDTLKHN